MNRVLIILLFTLVSVSCGNNRNSSRRVAVASAGDAILYLDEIPLLNQPGTSKADSSAVVQNYINRWAKKALMLQKAEDNLSSELSSEIDKQIEETRSDLVIYQYQRQMMLERMDTVITDPDLENYYNTNQSSFLLNTSIVKAVFIKFPVETPNPEKIRQLARSTEQTDVQELVTLCYQFADKYDDFSEDWIPLDRISVELPQEIDNEESFLRRTTFYESADSLYIYMVSIRDYRLRTTIAPFEYVKDDIKRIIWNNRRIEFIQSLENGIYNDALKKNKFRLL